MPVLPVLAFVLLNQNLQETYGKTHAQILAMGRSKWNNFYTEKSGGATTVSMSDAESLYANALGWRNDRFGKAKIGRLRTLLDSVVVNASDVGSAVTGGGTMWTIIRSSLSADGEETLYMVLSGKSSTPKHVVSDVEKSYTKLSRNLQNSESTAAVKKMGRDSLKELRKDLDGIIAEAARRPRKASDALLDFCIRAMSASHA